MTRVLVADNDDGVRLLYSTWLSEAGYHVEEAKRGDVALSLALHTPFDVVVLDAVLPVLDGVTVVKRLRAAQQSCHIIAASGGGPGIPADVALMLAGMFGIDRMLYKPINRHDLLAAVAEAHIGVALAAE